MSAEIEARIRAMLHSNPLPASTAVNQKGEHQGHPQGAAKMTAGEDTSED